MWTRFWNGIRGPVVVTALLPALLVAGPAAAKVKIAASTNDLGSIASSVGGDQVEVVAIARGSSDPHRVEVLPSYMVRVSRAQVYLKVGLGLDQWADQIIDGSHNGKLLIVDCSKGVNVLEKPTGKVDASMGDVHPEGNPHYWLDPRNAAIVAQSVAAALSGVDPSHADAYNANAAAFGKSAAELLARGQQVVAGLPSRDILTYHRSWPYLADAFGLQIVSTVEPIPGIPPTARHLEELVAMMKQRKVQVLLEEPYFSVDAGQFLARETGVRVVQEGASCDDVTAGSYGAHIDRVLSQIAGGKSGGGASDK